MTKTTIVERTRNKTDSLRKSKRKGTTLHQNSIKDLTKKIFNFGDQTGKTQGHNGWILCYLKKEQAPKWKPLTETDAKKVQNWQRKARSFGLVVHGFRKI